MRKSIGRLLIIGFLIVGGTLGGLYAKLSVDYIVNLQRQKTSEPVSPVSSNPIKPGFSGDKMDTSYRGYLQGLANGGDKNAKALLQVVGNDGNAGAFTDPHFVNSNGVSKADLINANNQYISKYTAPPAAAPTAATSNNSSGGYRTSSSSAGSSNNNAGQLQALLSSVDSGLNQALAKNSDQYNQQVGNANNSRDQALAGYQDQRIAQNKGKQSAYDTINQNANTGFNSLAQLIGRSAGTGSSAFQQLLPNVIGKDTSSKRQAATTTYGDNLAGIDKSQGQYNLNFQNTLQDLLNQKKQNEGDINIGAQNQRLGLQQQFATSPTQAISNINNSRNAVQSFFDQFRPQYTPQQAVAPTPDTTAYNTDRSTVNAQGQPGVDPTNPYSQILRRKLQEGA